VVYPLHDMTHRMTLLTSHRLIFNSGLQDLGDLHAACDTQLHCTAD
jgi:hypothetical protein